MIKRILIVGFILLQLLNLRSIAQEIKSFSLKEAQQYALENNYDIKNAGIDVKIAEKRVKENLALGLPQINAKANYNYYIDIPTTLMPDFLTPAVMGVNDNIYGLEPIVDVPEGTQYFEAQFGTKHNATLGAELSQLIFSGQYIVGVMASKAYVGLIEGSLQKSEIEIKDAIARSYYPVIILQENKKVFDSTLASLNKMLYETEEYYKSGFLEDTDVDQLKLLISDMETTITNIDNQLEIANNMLKYQMGIKADEEIEATESLNDLLAEVNRNYLLNTAFNYSDHIDYKMLKDQEKMAVLQLKLKKSEYYPTLMGYYAYQEDAMRDKFNFTASDQNWYTSQFLGVQLDIPIFSSGNRKYKVQQAKLELQKINIMDDQLKQGLSLKVRTAKANFNNAYLIYMNKNMSRDNAEKIYQKTEIKYREGLSSSLELSQTYNQFLTAQIDYLTSILDLLNKKSEVEKELTKVNY